jgi:hypothetical protein
MTLLMASTFATETIFRWPSVITMFLAIAGILVGWGVYKSIISQLRIDVTQHTKDIAELRKWGENAIVKAKKEREETLVSKDVFVEVINEFRRRMDEVNIIELNSRLARIEAQLDSIEITLKSERKP